MLRPAEAPGVSPLFVAPCGVGPATGVAAIGIHNGRARRRTGRDGKEPMACASAEACARRCKPGGGHQSGPRVIAESSAFTAHTRATMSVPPRAATRAACVSRYASASPRERKA